MALREIIKKYLDDNGFDGLCGDECGCQIGELFPCEVPDVDGCQPGYKTKCQGIEKCPYTKECPEPSIGNQEGA